MSAPLTRPQGRIPIGYAVVNGARVPVTIDLEWDRYFTVMDERAGGVSGQGTDDLSLAQFDDAGIEELKARLSQVQDELRMIPMPPEAPKTVAASGATWTEAEIDFGSKPLYEARFTITDAGIGATSKVQVLPCGKAATGRTADDWQWDGATFAALPAAGSATCYAVFTPGPIVGKRKVQYSVGA
jgi:hypothetical protein